MNNSENTSSASSAEYVVRQLADYISNNGYPHTRTGDEIQRDVREILFCGTAESDAKRVLESKMRFKKPSGQPVRLNPVAVKQLADLIISLSLRVAEQANCANDFQLCKEAESAITELVDPMPIIVPQVVQAPQYAYEKTQYTTDASGWRNAILPPSPVTRQRPSDVEVVQAPIEAWLIESYDCNDKLKKRVVLAPLTDDVHLDESSEAIALCRVEKAAPIVATAEPIDPQVMGRVHNDEGQGLAFLNSIGRTLPDGTALYAAQPMDLTHERAAFEKALKQSWEMVNVFKPPVAGSYAAYHQQGIIDALKTIKANFELANTAQGKPDIMNWKELIDSKDAEIARLNAIINTPQSGDFLRAVSIEAEHQRQRWGADGDAGKTAADWFWLIGYLAGKALSAHVNCNFEKAEHHIITTAAACLNWHAAMFGNTDMRPGIDGDVALAAKKG